MSRTPRGRAAAATESSDAQARTATAEQGYSTPRFMILGRQSATVLVNDPDGTPVRKSVAFVSLVPVGDDGFPLEDNIGALNVPTGMAGSGGAGGPVQGEFRVRIPSIDVIANVPDHALVTFALA
jgi:hypothetical protein